MTPAQRRRALGHFQEAAFVHHLGMRIDKLAYSEAVVGMPVTGTLKQYQGLVHGGALASLADTAATMAALTGIPGEDDVVTIEFKVNYLSAVRSGKALAHATLVRMGSRVVVIDVAVTKLPGGELAATGLFTMLRYQVETPA